MILTSLEIDNTDWGEEVEWWVECALKSSSYAFGSSGLPAALIFGFPIYPVGWSCLFDDTFSVCLS